MEIRQLRYFVSAATHMNFTKAAKECFIVQSSMAEQIANLENELGVKLFDRQRKGLVLTEAGEFFLPKAKAILSEAENARAEMDSFRAGYQCLLRIGYHGELFKTDLIQILKEYRKEQSAVRFFLRQLPERELIEGLRDGQFDVVLVPYKEAFEEEKGWMETRTVIEVGPVLVVAKDHPLAERTHINMAELGQLPLISFGDGIQEEVKTQISNFFAAEQALDHTSNEILIASGYGVSLWAERLSRVGEHPNLNFVEISDYPSKRIFALAWRRGKLSREGQRFCECLCKRVKGDG